MRWGFPAVLLAVLGLSCGSSSGEEVATDVVAFQPFSLREGAGVLAIKTNGDAVDYRSNAEPTILPGLKLRRVLLPFLEQLDGKFLQLALNETSPSTPAKNVVPSSFVRCFHGYVCQTVTGDIVDPGSFSQSTLRDFPEGRGATTCDGIYCVVGGHAVALDGSNVDVAGVVVDVVAVLWADIGGGRYRGGRAFLRADGSVATVGWDFENNYVAELTGLPPIRKIHRGGIYEDYSGHMWYVGVAPEGWADNLVPAEVPRRQCQVKPGKKLSPLDVACVGPTMLPALEGMLPQVIDNDAFIPILYALDKEGTLRCWSAPGGPACVKGE